LKILSKYVLREHVGPLTFALTALTSIMLLNFISRQFGELVGKGLPWQVIAEFFMLAIPFTVALTVPMSVLVAVLYAYSRLAAENEVTALKASGVSPWRLVSPAIAGGIVWSLGLLAFNDQVLPRANHRLAVLQADIQQAKPTFLLKEQVINPVSEGKLYLKAGRIDRAKGGMKEVVIYNMADPTQRRTIYADSGTVAFAANGKDLSMDLFHGQMQQVSTAKPGQLSRLFFEHDRLQVRDVGSGRDIVRTDEQRATKGDREMSVCEMQSRLSVYERGYQIARREYEQVKAAPGKATATPLGMAPPAEAGSKPPEARGLGWAYCKLVGAIFGVKKAQAAEIDGSLHHWTSDTIPLRDTAAKRDSTAKRDSAMKRDSAAKRDTVVPSPRARLQTLRTSRTPVPMPVQVPAPVPAPPAAGTTPVPNARTAAEVTEAIRVGGVPSDSAAMKARLAEAKLRLDMAQLSRNRYDIEIHKKFSLAAACLIFVLVGAPIAVRFPRGGVGLVIGVSLVVFALYYVGLIGGEALANAGLVPPFWAMWGTNVIMASIGVVMLLRMGRDQNTGRGGDWGDRFDALKARFRRRRHTYVSRGAL
jgi:lipopolysaccharide export system permease protein